MADLLQCFFECVLISANLPGKEQQGRMNPPASHSPQLAAGVASIGEWFIPPKER
jgi:hypothetical protein